MTSAASGSQHPRGLRRATGRAVQLPRVDVLLQHESWAINDNRAYPLYRNMGSQLRRKAPPRQVKAKFNKGRCAALGVNYVSAMEFAVYGDLPSAHP